MEAKYIIPQARIKSSSMLLPAIMLAFLMLAGSLNRAIAQQHNLSDWHVPPPLPPGTVTKGTTTGKTAPAQTIVLTPALIPALSLPPAPSVQVPVLAAVSTTPPSVKVPEQPALAADEPGLPEIPPPSAPGEPSLPKQTMQDAPLPATADLPLPGSPEMPALSTQPAASGPATNQKSPVPLTPDVISVPPALPAGGAISTWPTPGIPENQDISQ